MFSNIHYQHIYCWLNNTANNYQSCPEIYNRVDTSSWMGNTFITTIMGVIIGGVIAFVSAYFMMKFTRVNMTKQEIRNRFIRVLQEINSIMKSNTYNFEHVIKGIIVSNIRNVDPILYNLSFSISKRKRNKIYKHYYDYKKPYLKDSNDSDFIDIINKEVTFDNTIKTPKEKAITTLKILIKDFN